MQNVIVALFLSLIPIILFGLAAWLLIPGVRELKQGLASRGWPSIAGKIVSRTVVHIAPMDTRRSRSSYRPVLEYSFEVLGKSYAGTHRVFGDEAIAYGSPEKAQAIIDGYPPQREVQVYYDPTNPETAVLLPGRIGSVLNALVAGVVCLVLGLLTTWMVVAVAMAPPSK